MTIIILSITLMIITIAYLHQIAKTINQETTIKELKFKLHDINVEQEIRRHHQLGEDKEITDSHITNYFLEGE